MSLWQTHKKDHSTNMQENCLYCNDILNSTNSYKVFTPSETKEDGNRKTRRARQVFLNQLTNKGLIKFVGKESFEAKVETETINKTSMEGDINEAQK